MAIIDDTYRSDRPEAGPTGQGFGAMATPGYFSRAQPQTQMVTTPPIGTDHTSGPVDALTPRPTGPSPALPDQYDPDAGAMVPQANISGAFGRATSAVGGAIQSTFNSMASNVGTGFVPPAQAAETVAPSAQTARGPITDYAGGYPDQVSRNAASGGTPGLQTGRGPISGAADQGPQSEGRAATVYPDINVDDARARTMQQSNIISSLAAQDARQVQERNAGQIAQANAANAGQAADRAAGEARVANWRATNGADMVLAGGNQAYNSQRQGIINAAGQANANLAGANKAATDANTIAGQPVGNPIQDNLATQEGIQKGEQSIRANKSADIGNQLGQQKVKEGAAYAGMLDQLQKATDPKDIAVLQRKIAAFHGKPVDKVAIIDHDTGLTTRDMLGNVVPVFKKVAVDTTTGEILGDKPAAKAPYAGTPPLAEHVAKLKADPKLAAQFDAAYGPGAAAAALAGK